MPKTVNAHLIVCLSAVLLGLDGNGAFSSEWASRQDAVQSDVALYDCLNQTFVLLFEQALDAYLDHFSDEPEKLAVMHYYAGLLAADRRDGPVAREHFLKCRELAGDSEFGRRSSCWLDPGSGRPDPAMHFEMARAANGYQELPADLEPSSPQDLMHAAVNAARGSNLKQLARYLHALGASPQMVLQRSGGETARCLVYDPSLLWAHRRLAELQTDSVLGQVPEDVAGALAATAEEIRVLRAQPGNQQLSLRKFLDHHREPVWRLGWLFRFQGLQEEQQNRASAPAADEQTLVARTSYLRAFVIGQELFPASERGRMDQWDQLFLAQLGDVYARLGRYDLMLQYMYSDQGLPASLEMAKPIVELAYVAESVRLIPTERAPFARTDDLPLETLTQVLFQQPVLRSSADSPPMVMQSESRSRLLGWGLVGTGMLVIGTVIFWRHWARAVSPVED